jgi:hypothetical protein
MKTGSTNEYPSDPIPEAARTASAAAAVGVSPRNAYRTPAAMSSVPMMIATASEIARRSEKRFPLLHTNHHQGAKNTGRTFP